MKTKARKIATYTIIGFLVVAAGVSVWLSTVFKGSVLDKDAADLLAKTEDEKVVSFYRDVCIALRPAVEDSADIMLTAAENSVGVDDPTPVFVKANQQIKDNWVSAERNLPASAPRDVFTPKERKPVDYQPSLDALRSSVHTVALEYPDANDFDGMNEAIEGSSKKVSKAVESLGSDAPIASQGTLEAIKRNGECAFLFEGDDSVHDDVVAMHTAFAKARSVYGEGIKVYDDSTSITDETMRGKTVEYLAKTEEAVKVMSSVKDKQAAGDMVKAYTVARDVAREVLAQIDAQGITQESLNGWAGSIVDVNNDVQRAQIRFMKNNQVPNKPTQDAINRAVK